MSVFVVLMVLAGLFCLYHLWCKSPFKTLYKLPLTLLVMFPVLGPIFYAFMIQIPKKLSAEEIALKGGPHSAASFSIGRGWEIRTAEIIKKMKKLQDGDGNVAAAGPPAPVAQPLMRMQSTADKKSAEVVSFPARAAAEALNKQELQMRLELAKTRLKNKNYAEAFSILDDAMTGVLSPKNIAMIYGDETELFMLYPVCLAYGLGCAPDAEKAYKTVETLATYGSISAQYALQNHETYLNAAALASAQAIPYMRIFPDKDVFDVPRRGGGMMIDLSVLKPYQNKKWDASQAKSKRDIWTEGAAAGDGDCCYMQGDSYSGYDKGRAIEWFLRGAELRHADCLFRAGTLLLERGDEGGLAMMEEGLAEKLRRMRGSDDAYAADIGKMQFALAAVLIRAQKTEKYNDAVSLLSSATGNRNDSAAYYYALCQLFGFNCAQNIAEVKTLMARVANIGWIEERHAAKDFLQEGIIRKDSIGLLAAAGITVIPQDQRNNSLDMYDARALLASPPPLQSVQDHTPSKPVAPYANNVIKTPLEKRRGLHMQADRHQFLREKEKADRGDARASVYVGLTYLENNPQVVQADASLAAFYLKQASDAGMPQASYWLADLYESGEGIARDAQTARALLEKSAEAGYYLAQRDLAKIYLKEYEPAKMRAAFGYLKEYTDVALRDPSLINPESGDVILYPLMLAIGIFWIKNPKRSRELLQALAAKGYKSAIDTLEAGTIFPPESGYLLTESGLINVDDSEIYIPALMREIMES